MFKMANTGSVDPDTIGAATACITDLQTHLGQEVAYLMIHASSTYDIPRLLDTVRSAFPTAAIHGATSCQGALSGTGVMAKAGFGVAMIGLCDPTGDYGVGRASLGHSPKDAAVEALNRALDHARRPGQIPDLVWVSAAPGTEEHIIDGLQNVVGQETVIMGGSSADNDIQGQWAQFDQTGVGQNDIVVSALYPSVKVGTAFQNVYDPSPCTGIVTKAQGRRLIEIDHRPAYQVYNDWTNGLLGSCHPVDTPVNILADSSLAPLGRTIGSVSGIPFYVLSHPETLAPDGSMTLFTTIEKGDTLTLMSGTRRMLIDRAAQVVQDAQITGEIDPSEVSGAILVYCAGCMLTVQSEIETIHHLLADTLKTAPFLCTFTFGEQGRVITEENRHGNLMVSAVIFGSGT